MIQSTAECKSVYQYTRAVYLLMHHSTPPWCKTGMIGSLAVTAFWPSQDSPRDSSCSLIYNEWTLHVCLYSVWCLFMYVCSSICTNGIRNVIFANGTTLKRVCTLLSVSASNHKMRPCMLTATNCPQICWSIGQKITYNGAADLGSSCSDGMQHSE